MTPGDSQAVILARIEVKLDAALHQLTDHERRMRKLERTVWAWVGGAATAGGGIGAFLSGLRGGG